jgi:hypothetical protein
VSARTLIRLLIIEANQLLHGTGTDSPNQEMGYTVESLLHQMLQTVENAVYRKRLQCVEIKTAIHLLEQLENVFELQCLMKDLLWLGQTDNYNNDIVGYHCVIEMLIEEAIVCNDAVLGNSTSMQPKSAIHSCLPELSQLMGQRDSLQAQIDALQALETSLSTHDDTVIRDALERVKQLTRQYGFSVHVDRVEKAEQVLKSLQAEIDLSNHAMESMNTLYSEYTYRVRELLEEYNNGELAIKEDGSPDNLSARSMVDNYSTLWTSPAPLKQTVIAPRTAVDPSEDLSTLLTAHYDRDLSLSVVGLSKQCLTVIEQTLNGAGLVASGIAKAGGGRRRSMMTPTASATDLLSPRGAVGSNLSSIKFQCHWTATLFACFHQVHVLLLDLLSEDWTKLENSIQKIHEFCVHTLNLTSEDSTLSLTTVPATMRAQFAAAILSSENVISVARREWERRRFLLKIANALHFSDSEGSLLNNEAVDSLQSDLQAVVGAAEAHNALGDDVLCVVERAFRLLACRKAQLNSDFDAACRSTDPSPEITVKRENLARSLRQRIYQLNANDPSTSVEDVADREDQPALRVGLCGGLLKRIHEVIDAEMHKIRQQSVNELTRSLMREILVATSKASQELPVVSAREGLHMITHELPQLMLLGPYEGASLGNVFYDEITRALFQCVEILQHCELLSAANDMLALSECLFADAARMSTLLEANSVLLNSSDACAKSCLVIILKALLRLQRDATNHVCSHALLETLSQSDAHIRGVIGNLVIEDACVQSVTHLDFAIKAAETARERANKHELMIALTQSIQLLDNGGQDIQSAGTNIDMFSALLDVCTCICALRKAFIDFKRQALLELEDEQSSFDAEESGSNTSTNVYIRSLNDLTARYQQTHQSSITIEDDGADYYEYEDVSTMLKLAMYDKTHLQLIEKAKSAVNSRHLFIKEDNDAVAEITEELDEDENEDDDEDDDDDEDVDENAATIIPSGILDEISLLENEILYCTSIKLLIKGIFDCSTQPSPIVPSTTMTSSSVDAEAVGTSGNAAVSVSSSSATSDNSNVMTILSPECVYYYAIRDSLDYPPSHKHTCASSGTSHAAANVAHIVTSVVLPIPADVDAIHQEAVNSASVGPVAADNHAGMTEPVFEINEIAVDTSKAASQNDDANNSVEDILSSFQMHLDAHDDVGEVWERKAQRQADTDSDFDGDEAEPDGTATLQSPNYRIDESNGGFDEDNSESNSPNESRIEAADEDYGDKLARRLSAMIDKATAPKLAVDGVSSDEAFYRHYYEHYHNSAEAGNASCMHDQLQLFQKVNINLDSGLKLYQLLTIFLDQCNSLNTLPSFLVDLATFATSIQHLRESVLLLVASSLHTRTLAIDVSEQINTCLSIVQQLNADVDRHNNMMLLFRRMFAAVFRRELAGVVKFLTNEQTIYRLVHELADNHAIVSEPDNAAGYSFAGLLYIGALQTQRLQAVLRHTQEAGLMSVRAYNLYALALVLLDLRVSIQDNNIVQLDAVLKHVDHSVLMQDILSLTSSYVPLQAQTELLVCKQELSCIRIIRTLVGHVCSPDSSVKMCTDGSIDIDSLSNQLLEQYLDAVAQTLVPNSLSESMHAVCIANVTCNHKLQDWIVRQFRRFFSQQAQDRRFAIAPADGMDAPDLSDQLSAVLDPQTSTEAANVKASLMMITEDELIASIHDVLKYVANLSGSLQGLQTRIAALLDRFRYESGTVTYIPHENARFICEQFTAVLSQQAALFTQHLRTVECFLSVRKQLVLSGICAYSHSSPQPPSSRALMVLDHRAQIQSPFSFSHANISHLVSAISTYNRHIDDGRSAGISCDHPAMFHTHIDIAHKLVVLRRLSQTGCWKLLQTQMQCLLLPVHIDIPLTADTESNNEEPHTRKHARLEKLFVCNSYNCVCQMHPVVGAGHLPSQPQALCVAVDCALCVVADELCAYQIEIVNRWAIDSLFRAIAAGQVTPNNYNRGSDTSEAEKETDKHQQSIDVIQLQAVIDKVIVFPELWTLTAQLLATAQTLVNIRRLFVHSNEATLSKSKEREQKKGALPLNWHAVLQVVEPLLGPTQSAGLTIAHTQPQFVIGGPNERLHGCCLDELHVVRSLAREQIVWEQFKTAVQLGRVNCIHTPPLESNGAQAAVGHARPFWIANSVSVVELEKACELANTAFVAGVAPSPESSTDANARSLRCAQFGQLVHSLIQMRKYAIALNNYMQPSPSKSSHSHHHHHGATPVFDIVRSVHQLLHNQLSVDKQPASPGSTATASDVNPWIYICDEVAIIAEFVCLHGLHAVIEQAHREALSVHKRRGAVGINELLVHITKPSDARDQLLLLPTRLLVEMQTISKEMMLAVTVQAPTHSPDGSSAEASETNISRKVFQYHECVQSIVRLRDTINCGSWLSRDSVESDTEFVNWLVSDELTKSMTVSSVGTAGKDNDESVPTAEQLLAHQECLNIFAFQRLSAALRLDTTNAVGEIESDDHEEHAAVDGFIDLCDSKSELKTAPVTESVVNTDEELPSAASIASAIAQAESLGQLTSHSVGFLLECSKQLLRLRETLSAYKHAHAYSSDMLHVAGRGDDTHNSERLLLESLQWFQTHSPRCPLFVRQEYLRADLQYTNRSLYLAMSQSLADGGLYPGCEVSANVTSENKFSLTVCR